MMSRTTGRAIAPAEHLRQSIADIIATPIGTRVMRRDYGSQVPMLVDQPDNKITEVRLFSAAASSIMRWEPRISISQIGIERNPETPGKVLLTVEGDELSPAAVRARALRLTVPATGSAAQ